MGLSWNVFSGLVGLISFGHAAFFGLGAYTVTLCLVDAGLTPWVGIPVGAAVGGLAGFVIGLPVLRLRGHYFALAMLAYPLLFQYVLQYLGLDWNFRSAMATAAGSSRPRVRAHRGS